MRIGTQPTDPKAGRPTPELAQDRQAARRVLIAFLLTFLGAVFLALLIMARNVPDLFLYLGGTHVHHLNYGMLLLTGVAGHLL